MIRAYTAQPIQTAVCSSHPASRSAQFLHKYVCTAKQRGTSCRRVQAVPRGCGRAGNGGGRHKHSCRGVRGIWLVHWSHRARPLPKIILVWGYSVWGLFPLLAIISCCLLTRYIYLSVIWHIWRTHTFATVLLYHSAVEAQIRKNVFTISQPKSPEKHGSWRAVFTWFQYIPDFGSNGSGIPDFGSCPFLF